MLVERRIHDGKVVSSSPGMSGGRIFFPRINSVLTLIRCPFHPVLPQWHVKDLRPLSFCQNAGGSLHLITDTPLTQRSWSRLTKPLCRHSMGTYREMSSHATRQATLNHSYLSSSQAFSMLFFSTTGLSHRDFSHRKVGLLSPRKSSCD